MDLYVTNKNGERERFNTEDIHSMILDCSEGLDISVSQIEINLKMKIFDGITTAKIQEEIIKSSSDLISKENPDYSLLAGRLSMVHLRKQVFKDNERERIPSLDDFVSNMVKKGLYDSSIYNFMTEEELKELDEEIKHDRDFNIKYSGAQQLIRKYLIMNRAKAKSGASVYECCYETPQFLFMMVGVYLFGYKYQDNPEQKMRYIKDFYHEVSLFKISLPTPIASGVRTKVRQFSSCVLGEVGDSLKSINSTAAMIIEYISKKAGIGIQIGRIRALGSPIRNGDTFHTGIIPFIKHFQTAVKSCSQGGVRGGAATMFYPFWHREFKELIVLKNNRGIEENRVRHLDYCVQLNKFFYERFIRGEDISLFSPSDVPGLFVSFFEDQNKFEELYLKYENDKNITKEIISAKEMFILISTERAQTGRIYIQNVDHSNTHSSFIENRAPIHTSNLCLEITLPTNPVGEDNSEIALCTLSAINLNEIKDLKELEYRSEIIVRYLDALLDYQDYPREDARKFALSRRSLGVGVTGFADYLAKNKVKYSDDSAIKLTHETFEAIQYYLLKASNKLAKEQGSCKFFYDTKYSKGILPIDTYKKDIDSFCDVALKLNWEKLRKDIKKYGLRNSTLTALMPCETSSQISGTTNGIEPPRDLITVKSSKDGILKTPVSGIKEYSDFYETLWDIPNNRGYIKLVSIMQKFVDQSISANTNYDPSKFIDNKVPIKEIIQDIMLAYKYGLKTLYYHNTRDGANHNMETFDSEEECSSGACKL